MAKEDLQKDLGLVVVGNALVDVLARVDSDALLEKHGMEKGKMNLASAAQGRAVYDDMPESTEMSGGSGANSLAVFASFGGKGGFIGKTADDELGEIFRHDLKAQGVEYSTPLYEGDEETGRSYIIVTPDKERTMNTYLGASVELEPEDVDEDMIARADILLLEGYLFDKPKAKQAFMKAAQAAKDAGTRVAFTLSDAGCVKRHYGDFRALAEKYVDILIGNEEEAKAITLKEDFAAAAEAARGMCDTVVLTKGKDGAVIFDKGQRYDISSVKPEKIVDTTGAGDAFAGGVLYGLSRGMSPDQAGLLGAKAASRTISHIGARNPDVKFSDLLP